MKCAWCQDVERHQADLKRFTDQGLPEDHPLLRSRRNRIRGAEAFAAREHGANGPCDRE